MRSFTQKISYIFFLLFLSCGGTGTVQPEGFAVYDITENPSQTTAVITYKTTLPAKTILNYGFSGGVIASTIADTADYTLDHSISLEYLTSDTGYDYSITAWTEDAQTYDSEILTFNTLPKAQDEPIITGLTVSNITATSAIVSWFTDEASTSVVLYDTTAVYSDSVKETNLVTQHQLQITGLQQQTLYYFQAASDDIEGYRGLSQDSTFTSGQYIYLNLTDTTTSVNSVIQYPVIIAGAQDLGGLQYQLQFDTTYLTAVDIVEGPFTLDNNHQFFYEYIYNEWEYLENYITWQSIFQGGLLVGTQADGGGIVAYINFLTKNTGATTVSVNPDSSIFLDMFIQPIDGAFTDGHIIIQ